MYYKNKNDSIKTIKKKGGIIIKRKIFLITLLCTIIFSILNVHAETASFFEAEYIRGIYESKYMYSNNTIYYQTARFFRKSDTHLASSPGPHAIILVLRLRRYTQEEQQTVALVKNLFGEAAMKYMIILFTCRDELRNQSLSDFLKDADVNL